MILSVLLATIIGCSHTASATDPSRPAAATRSLVLDATLTMTEMSTDRYGRTIAEVRLADGRSLNRDLVKAGACWWYRKYAPRDTELDQLETEAREQRRGLWETANPMPLWEWRKQH